MTKTAWLGAVLVVASLAFVTLSPRALEGPLGNRNKVRKAILLTDFRGDFNRGHVWKPSDVVEMLQSRPEASLYVGNFGLPVGSPTLLSIGRKVDGWQEAVRAHNAAEEPDLDLGKICVPWRPDVILKYVDGSGGEKSCSSLIDDFVCAPPPCWRHFDNPCTRWHGAMEDHWGSPGAFDTDWLLSVPAQTWQTIVDKYYDGEDFCTGDGNRWGLVTDKKAICEVNTADRKVVLYSNVSAETRRMQATSGVGIDLRIPEAREWNARRLMSLLKSMGIDPGEPGCVVMGYKPGMWANTKASRAGVHCPSDEVRSWSGFVTPANRDRCPAPRPVMPTPYEPGEFEQAMNEQMRDVFRLLDEAAPAAMQVSGSDGTQSYSQIRFIFTERPNMLGRSWALWDDDIRSSSRVLGEMHNVPTPFASKAVEKRR